MGGVLYFVVYEGIIEPNQLGHKFGSSDAVEIAIGLMLALFGIFSVVFSEIAEVLVKIEENTTK